MIRNNLEAIAGINIYPIISLTIFFVFFSIMLIWVIRADKKYINNMAGMPLENDPATHPNFTNHSQKGDI